MNASPRTCIVGIGLIGGSIGLAAKANGATHHVIGVETNTDTWADALRIGAVDEITNDLATGVRGVDLVILAVPVDSILAILPELPALIGENIIVTDVGSVKTAIAGAGFAALGERFVPGHPLAGSERGGVVHARADLFGDAIWAIVPPINSVTGAAQYVTDFVTKLKATPLHIAAAAHDEAVALTSHLPHVLAYTLSAMLTDRTEKEKELLLALSAGSWKSATRVADSSPELWTEIANQNASSLVPLLHEFANKLNTIATALGKGETDSVKQHFINGNVIKQWKREIKLPPYE